MKTAENGNTVSVKYCGKFPDGTIFDSSDGREDLKFVLGANQVIKGFDDAVLGMKEGDKVTVTIAPEKAYGAYSEDLVIKVPKQGFPENIKLEKGLNLELSNREGNRIPVVVLDFDEEAITLDANHPLAGKELVFDIELTAIE